MRFILFFIVSTLTSFFAEAQNYKKGLSIPTAVEAQKAAISIQAASAVPLKRQIYLTRYVPAAKDQGWQSSCVGWSVGYGLFTFLKAKEMRWSLNRSDNEIIEERVYSPSYIYNSYKPDATCDSGLFLSRVLDSSKIRGIVSYAEFPYDTAGCGRMPTEAEKTSALNTRLLDYKTLFNYWQDTTKRVNVTSIKRALNDSNAVVIGIQWDYTNFSLNETQCEAQQELSFEQFDPDDCPMNDTIPGCYHAMLCVGYDEKYNSFLVFNSWGTNWGNCGYIWIKYDVFRRAVKEAYTAVLRPQKVLLTEIDPNKGSTPRLKEQGNYYIDSISESNWVKTGYYRTYAGINIGCQYLDPRQEFAVMKISDDSNENIISTNIFRIGEEPQVFEYKNYRLSLKLTKIDRAGSIFNFRRRKAAFYSFTLKSIGGYPLK